MNSTERRAKILDTIQQLEALRAHVRDNNDGLTKREHDEFTARALVLNAELQAALTEGANPCPVCKVEGVPLPAFGLAHESQGKGGTVRYLYEVGCKNAEHRNARATDLLPELAVERWNAGDYDAPRTGPAKAPGE